jgi:hypothetical protein
MRVRVIARSFFVLELFTLTARFGRLDSIIGSPPANARLYRHAESVPCAALPCASESREDVPMAPRDHVLERGMYAHAQLGGGGRRVPKHRPCSEGPNATCGKRGRNNPASREDGPVAPRDHVLERGMYAHAQLSGGGRRALKVRPCSEGPNVTCGKREPHNPACPDADPKRRNAMNSASKRAGIVAKTAANRRAADKRKSAAGANSTADKKARVVAPPRQKGRDDSRLQPAPSSGSWRPVLAFPGRAPRRRGTAAGSRRQAQG